MGANKELVKHFPDLEVAGNAMDEKRIPCINKTLQPGDTLTLGQLSFEVRFVPGHTSGHMAWIGHGAAFVGDTLFSLGCGRLFEGTPQQMHHSLTTVLGDLPDETDIYCAHEYTLSNLKFAKSILPQDMDLDIAAREVQALRDMDCPTVPSTMNFERAHNPFLRCHEPMVQKAIEAKVPGTGADPVRVFAAMRQLKDNF